MDRTYFVRERPASGPVPGYSQVGYTTPDEPNCEVFASYRVWSQHREPSRPATDAEVAAFVAEHERIERNKREREAREAALLALCGLTHADFVRFREVDRFGDDLQVTTRENGVNAVSADAIRNPNYRDRRTDEGDETYAHYTFAIPAKKPRARKAKP